MTIPVLSKPWDYLIVTASNEAQEAAYLSQISLRRRLGLLPDFREAMVVADPGGKRIGSGGSTICCLMRVLDRERAAAAGGPPARADLEAILRRLRILIVHAGGDSRRLPAYGPCGKIFVPVPGDSDAVLTPTIFDRLLPSFLALPPGRTGAGQVLVASGDALIRFDAAAVRLDRSGLIALGCLASPPEASRHGVFCPAPDGRVRLYLQKPEPETQSRLGAVNRYGQTILDIGVMSFDAEFGLALLDAFEVAPDETGQLALSPRMRETISGRGLDLYREICCALGTEATAAHHLASARGSGSVWDEADLARLHAALNRLPLRVEVLPRSSFLHFGTSRQLIASGLDLVRQDGGAAGPGALLRMNTEVGPGGSIAGSSSWVEGCRVSASLALGGQNVVVGVDVDAPLALQPGACLETVEGRDRDGRPAWFVRLYGIKDTFKDPAAKGATFCGRPILEWMRAVGAGPEDIWDRTVPPDGRTLWEARVFPAESGAAGYRRWLWMAEPRDPSEAERAAFLGADRYSAAEISLLADQEAFHDRRRRIRTVEVRGSLRRLFRSDSDFSAEELAHALAGAPDRAAWVAEILADARSYPAVPAAEAGRDAFVPCRILHSLATAVSRLDGGRGGPLDAVLPGIARALPPDVAAWLRSAGLVPADGGTADAWCRRLREHALERVRATVLGGAHRPAPAPRNALRPDETIWGRAPARLELGGGWTDTVPCSLERGGTVANAAIDLNGQPPIHCYCRVIREPVIRLTSIDAGERVEISSLDALEDCRRPGDPFAAAKAALAISGFSPRFSAVPAGASLREALEAFGGGIELTTLVGVPQASGLGTSSITGAVVLAVVARLLGRQVLGREVFRDVLRLQQAVGSGGGWQDAVGGGVGGAKITTATPGLLPDWSTLYMPADVLDPRTNGGSTLLYYTGRPRVVKDVVRHVVGGYLDRDRALLGALAQEHQVTRCIAEALARKDAALLGEAIDVAGGLQKRIAGDGADEAIDGLLARVRPRLHGARPLGPGSGGFLLLVGRSPADARAVREMLEAEPPNDRARFFGFHVNATGLEVTAC